MRATAAASAAVAILITAGSVRPRQPMHQRNPVNSWYRNLRYAAGPADVRGLRRFRDSALVRRTHAGPISPALAAFIQVLRRRASQGRAAAMVGSTSSEMAW